MNTTSNKKSKKHDRDLKKQANQRTMEDRQRELDVVFTKFQELGISTEFAGISEFYKIANDFIKFANPCSGKIYIDELGKNLLYLLNNNKKHEIQVLLRQAQN